MTLVKTSIKGQIVIPAKLREKYRIKPGDKVEIRDASGKIIIEPALKDPVKDAFGFLKKRGKTSLVDDLLGWRKEELNAEDVKITGIRGKKGKYGDRKRKKKKG